MHICEVWRENTSIVVPLSGVVGFQDPQWMPEPYILRALLFSVAMCCGRTLWSIADRTYDSDPLR